MKKGGGAYFPEACLAASSREAPAVPKEAVGPPCVAAALPGRVGRPLGAHFWQKSAEHQTEADLRRRIAWTLGKGSWSEIGGEEAAHVGRESLVRGVRTARSSRK